MLATHPALPTIVSHMISSPFHLSASLSLCYLSIAALPCNSLSLLLWLAGSLSLSLLALCLAISQLRRTQSAFQATTLKQVQLRTLCKGGNKRIQATIFKQMQLHALYEGGDACQHSKQPHASKCNYAHSMNCTNSSRSTLPSTEQSAWNSNRSSSSQVTFKPTIAHTSNNPVHRSVIATSTADKCSAHASRFTY